jgi:MFS family permease
VKQIRKRGRRPAPDVRGWLRRLGQRLPWYTPGDSQEARNVRGFYVETAWFGLLSGIAATFVPVYALRLGATTAQVGWLTALPALVNVVWLIPAGRLIERQRRRMPLIRLTGLLQRLGFLAMALVPWLIPDAPVEALVLLNALVTLPGAVVSTAITALIPDLASPEHRGQVVSTRWLILSATATLSALLGGRFLDLFPVPLNYQLLLGIGALLSMLSLGSLRRIRVPDAVPPPRRAQRGSPPTRSGAEQDQKGAALWRGMRALRGHVRRGRERLRGGLAGILARREFVRFAAASFVFSWGLYLPAALWSVLRVRELGASDTWIGLIAVVIDGSMIAGYLYWGKVRARRGNRWLLVVTSLGVTVYALVTAVVPSIAWMIPTSILGGFTWAGCNLALFDVMLSVCPGDRRASYVALYTALTNVTAFAGPLLGAAVSDGLGIRWAFVVAAGVRLAGSLLFLLLLSPRIKAAA